jgi:hypothetical protein
MVDVLFRVQYQGVFVIQGAGLVRETASWDTHFGEGLLKLGKDGFSGLACEILVTNRRCVQ